MVTVYYRERILVKISQGKMHMERVTGRREGLKHDATGPKAPTISHRVGLASVLCPHPTSTP